MLTKLTFFSIKPTHLSKEIIVQYLVTIKDITKWHLYVQGLQ